MNFFFETTRLSIASIGVKQLLLSKVTNILFNTVTSNDRASEFQVNLRIYRFGTLGLSPLVKQAKFADQRDFLLSSRFPVEWGCNGRYQVLGMERSIKMLVSEANKQ